MDKDEQAICDIHGKFYSGYPQCPICKAEIKEDEDEG